MTFYEDMNRREQHDVAFSMEKAHDMAEQFLDSQRIDMDSFTPPSGNYDSRIVEEDKATVEHLRAKWEDRMEKEPWQREAKHSATVFEAMLSKHTQDSMWFGGNAKMIHTSDFDDYVNHVDGVLHFKDGTRNDFLGLGIDVTFSQSRLPDKIEKIVKEIEDGEMAKIKYFELPDKSFKGELSQIPRIIFAAEGRSVVQMAEQWVRGEDSFFKKHWMQFQLIEIAIEQCDVFGSLAQHKGKKEIAERYAVMKNKLQSILNLRKKLVDIPESRDSMSRKMRDILSNIK